MNLPFLLDLFHLGFLQRAFLAGAVVAVVCPAVGLFLVVRRLSLLGECLAHVALAGAALGLAAGLNAYLTATAASVVAAAALEYLRRAYARHADLALAVTVAAGLGLTAVLAGRGAINLAVVMGYLFGSLVAITPQELALVLYIGGGLILALAFLYRDLFYLALDEQGAKVAGIPVGPLSLFSLVLAGVAVSLTMRLIGALLLASLMTLPVAGALALARSFRQALFLSVALAELATLSGLTLAYYFNTAPGGTVVLDAVALLALILALKAWKERYRTRKGDAQHWTGH